MAKKAKIRPLAICVFRDGDRIFAAEGYDPVRQQTFYRPLGGGIEFGEYGHETLVREIREEINQEIRAIRYLGTLENIFTYADQPGHEIVLVYDACFCDELVYQSDGLIGIEEEDTPTEFRAVWCDLDDFRHGRAIVYPDGLVELLDNNKS